MPFVILKLSFLYDYDGHFSMESDSYNKLWLRVQYLAQLGDSSLNNIRFNGIDIYNTSRCQHSIDGSLVPYISKKDYDKVANEFLTKFYPEAFNGKTIDPCLIAGRMGLKTIKRRIKEDGSVFGQSFFMNAKAKFYNNETHSYYEKEELYKEVDGSQSMDKVFQDIVAILRS